MSKPYESSYRKIALESEIPPDEPVVYRAAGATIVLRRHAGTVEAIDGSCLAESGEVSSQLRLQRIMQCVASGAGSESLDWDALVARVGLPVRVADGVVWVCIDGCEQS